MHRPRLAVESAHGALRVMSAAVLAGICLPASPGRTLLAAGPESPADIGCDARVPQLAPSADGHVHKWVSQYQAVAEAHAGAGVPPNDDCNAAIPVGVGSFGFSTVGATTDGPVLPPSCEEGFGLDFGQDMWFCYTASCAENITINLCGSLYDTRMAVYEQCICPADNTRLVACNDDLCNLRSYLSFAATAGAQYLIRVGGYAAESGDGVMDISCGPPCAVTCPPGSLPEGEPTCADEYADAFNGGCNWTPFVFSPLDCGDTVCGTYGNYLYQGDNFRDTDWYQFSTAGGEVSWTATSEGMTRLYLIQPQPNCTNFTIIATAAAVPCEPATVTVTVGPGNYYAFVATNRYVGLPCGSPYTATLTCQPLVLEACCALNGTCADQNPADCTAAGGAPGGPGTACSGDADGNGWDDSCGDPPPPAATIVSALSRKPNPSGPGGVCDINLLPPRKSEPRNGRITELRIGFDVPPGAPGGSGVTIEQAICADPDPMPYSGASAVTSSVAGNELVLMFAPGLENARAYRIILGPEVTAVAGQTVEVRGLIGDANGNGRVDGADRSEVMGLWSGGGFACHADLNNDGRVSDQDRGVVVGWWTGAQNCAP